jgi:cell division protein FtsB
VGFLIGLIAMCIVFVLLLPLMAFLYIDTLETRIQAKQQMEKVEKLRQEVERKKDEQ